MSEAIKEVLDEEINQDAEIAEEAGYQRFEIDDDGKAEWALKKIKEAEAEILNWRSYYKDSLEKIERRQNSRIDYLKHLLKRYFNGVPHHDTKTQSSYDLPSGKLIEKRPGPKYETDDAVLVPWLKENGLTDFVKTEIKEKAAWGEFKKTVTVAGENVVTEDGEIVPGVTVIEQEPTFEVK